MVGNAHNKNIWMEQKVICVRPCSKLILFLSGQRERDLTQFVQPIYFFLSIF